MKKRLSVPLDLADHVELKCLAVRKGVTICDLVISALVKSGYVKPTPTDDRIARRAA